MELLKDLMFLILKILFIGLFFTLLFLFVFGFFRVPDMEMAPSVREGDVIIFNRMEKEYTWWDCVILEREGQKEIRRVVAVEGDVVDLTVEDGLTVNGYPQQEPYIYEVTDRYETPVEFPVRLGKGQIFVLSDARENATDSRVYGVLNAEDTLGKVMLQIRKQSF